MAERAIRKERNVWMGSDTESAKQMLLRARNTHLSARQDRGGIFRPNAQSIILSLEDIHLDIDSIRDIAYAIPDGYLICGSW